jgi:RimJ/RimL family protein N-acetyltransferase
LRGWVAGDFEPYAALVAHPESARFITRTGQPYSKPQAWAEMAFFIGHWQLLGYGMFVVEELQSGSFIGRVGPLRPPGWPDFEVGWALTPESRGKGYASEAARATIDWSFEALALSRIISVIHPKNRASQQVAKRVGETRTEEQFSPFGEACDIWHITRDNWRS